MADYGIPWDDYARRVRQFEGNPNSPNFLRPTWDVRQYTSGYGTRAAGPNERIDMPEAERRFNQEFGNARDRVQAFAPDLSTGRQAALSSLTMNAGPGWMNQGLGEAVKRGDWADARQRFLQYTSPDPRYQAGLANRRQQEAGWLADAQPAAGPGGDLGDPRWGQLPMMNAAREQMPGAIAMGLGAGGVRPPDWQPPTRRGLVAPPYAPDDTPMPPLMPRPAPDPFGVADPFGGGPPQQPLPPVSGFGDMTPPGPDYAAPGPAAPPPQPDYAAPLPMPPPDRADPFSALPGISMTPPTPMPQPPPPTLQEMGVSPGFGTGLGIPGGALGPLAPGTSGQLPPSIATGDTPPSIRPPITDSGPPPSGLPAPRQQQVEDKSLAGRMFGADVAGGLRGAYWGMMPGLSVLARAPQLAGLGIANQRAAIEQAQEARTATTFGQSQGDRRNKELAFASAFPQGAAGPPDMKSPLVRGLTAPAASAVGAMGVDEAVTWLGKYQLADSEKRADMERRLELSQRIDAQYDTPSPTGAPSGPPAPMPAPAAPMPALPWGGAGIGGAMPGVSMPTPAPTPMPMAPAAQAPVAPAAPAAVMGRTAAPAGPSGPGVPAQPMVTIGNRSWPLAVAQQKAETLSRVGMKDEVLEKAIANAQTEAAVPPAVRQDAAKTDQAYHIISNSLDRYNKIIQSQDKLFSFGGFVGQSAARDAAMAEYDQILLQMKDLHNLGQLSKSDIELASALPDPRFSVMGQSGFNIPTNIKERTELAVERIKERLRDVRNIKAGAIGLSPVPAAAPTAGAAPQATSRREPDEVRHNGGKTFVRYGQSWFEQ